MKTWYPFRLLRVIALCGEVMIILPWWWFKRHVLGYKQITNQDQVKALRIRKAKRKQRWGRFWSFLDQPNPNEPAHCAVDERDNSRI
jgi:hypothetical protein